MAFRRSLLIWRMTTAALQLSCSLTATAPHKPGKSPQCRRSVRSRHATNQCMISQSTQHLEQTKQARSVVLGVCYYKILDGRWSCAIDVRNDLLSVVERLQVSWTILYLPFC